MYVILAESDMVVATSIHPHRHKQAINQPRTNQPYNNQPTNTHNFQLAK